jgi:hypothetical protein
MSAKKAGMVIGACNYSCVERISRRYSLRLPKENNIKKDWGMAQVVEHMPSKHESLSSQKESLIY